MNETFDRIYRDNLWNGDETRSGPGSGRWATRRIAPAIVDLVEVMKIESVLDVGCGEGFWSPDLPGYVGFDVSEVALARARENHPDRTYTSVWPSEHFDLAICRDVLQHLPLGAGVRLLDRIKDRAGMLLASTYIGGENFDIPPGDAYSPNLEVAPFNLGAPILTIFDGYHYHDTEEQRDPAKHLGLWALG